MRWESGGGTQPRLLAEWGGAAIQNHGGSPVPLEA